MTKTRRITIFASSEQTLAVRRTPAARPSWCAVCAARAVMVTPDEAAALTRQSARDVYRLVEAGALHFTEGQAGVLICLASLAAGSGFESVAAAAGPAT
ncbi:MAG: hypothetical protein H7Z38_04940 [Rubrivivax sp.]|nr:hypothetical protein [Pyrinomonadaceae bacterium]